MACPLGFYWWRIGVAGDLRRLTYRLMQVVLVRRWCMKIGTKSECQLHQHLIFILVPRMKVYYPVKLGPEDVIILKGQLTYE